MINLFKKMIQVFGLKSHFKGSGSTSDAAIPRHLFTSLMESVNDGIVVIDKNGKFVLFNPKAFQILGNQEASTDPNKWSQFYGLYYTDNDQQIPTNELPLMRALAGEKIDQFKVRLRRNGQIDDKFISVSAAPLVDSSGVQTGASAIFRDISEEFRLHQQIAQGHKMEAMGRLAGGVAHDFNNKLGTILLTCDFMQTKIKDPQLVDLTNHIRQVANQAAALTTQLLAFSRKQVILPEIIDVKKRILSNMKFLHQLIGEDIEIDMKGPEGDSLIKVDPSQIDQVIINLCTNSRDAMPHGGKITIEVTPVEFQLPFMYRDIKIPVGEYIMLAISDTGIGMSEELKSKIYEPFFTTKPIFEGTGLGLSMVEGIIKQHNGEILVFSKVGEGTTFKIFFPRSYEKNRKLDLPEIKITQKSGEEVILLLEDDDNLREVTFDILTSRGYKVIMASKPSQVENLVHENPDIRLLLTDLIMPGKNGKQVADEVENYHPNIKVIFMSGYTNNIIEQKGAGVPQERFLQKPVSSEDMFKMIRETLDYVPEEKKAA